MPGLPQGKGNPELNAGHVSLELQNVPSIIAWTFLCGIPQYGGQFYSELTMPLVKPALNMKH